MLALLLRMPSGFTDYNVQHYLPAVRYTSFLAWCQVFPRFNEQVKEPLPVDKSPLSSIIYTSDNDAQQALLKLI